MRLSRRTFSSRSLVLAAMACGWSVLPGGCGIRPVRTSKSTPHIGYLAAGPREARALYVDAFVEGLRQAGWVEGQTITIDWRFTADGNDDQFHDLAPSWSI